MSDVALRHRVPNPPPVFVGRGSELERLKAFIERGPVSVVWGLGGLGKSALVAEVLRRSFAKELSRAILVGMRPGDSVDQLRGDALAALVRANGLEDDALEETPRDPDAVVATLIDLAERQKIFVVLEDLHHGDFEAVKALLRPIARYARDSRWIVATRQDPGLDEIAEQVLALPAMSDGDLMRLATSIADIEEATEAVVVGVRGLPWRLRQLVAGARLDDENDPSLFVHVTDEARRLLDHMVHLDLPLAVETLARITPLPSADEVALLERRGMIERSARGLRLHDVARAVLAARPRQGVERTDVARALAGLDDPAAIIEALRLQLTSGDVDGAQALLREHRPQLTHAGFAPRLWDLLEGSADPRFLGIRRQLAVAVRTDHAVAWAAAQGPPDAPPGASSEALEERLAWVRALSLRAAVANAAQAADALRSDATAAGAESIRLEATLLAARARYGGGRPREAVDILRRYKTSDVTAGARRDAMLARCLSAAGEYAEALAIVDALAPFTLREIQQHRAAVLFSAGRLRATSEVLARGGSELSTSPRTILRRMHIAIETGDLRGGREAHESLLRFPRLLPVERMHMLTMGCRLALALGELDEVDRNVDELLAMAPEVGNARLYSWTRVIRLVSGIVRAREVPALPWLEHIPPPSGATAAWLGTFEGAYDLRRRGSRSAPPIAIPDIVNLEVLSRVTIAEEALHRGDHELALRRATESIDLAREHGWAIHEADGLRLRGEIHACAGSFAEAERQGAELAVLAEKMASPRYASEARLLLLLGKPVPDVSALFAIAQGMAHAPEAARRARRLLALDGPTDALDLLVVAAAQRRWSGVVIEVLGEDKAIPAATTFPRWGIDLIAREVHMEGSEAISLRRHGVLLRVLEVCADGSGPITKEKLAREVWSVSRYHPHRDDARIEMAVSRLRRLLDSDRAPAEGPTHIVTTAEGYRLAGPVWVVRPAR